MSQQSCTPSFPTNLFPTQLFPTQQGPFVIYDEAFYQVIGKDPTLTLVAETSAHEGPVYYQPWNALLYTTAPVDTDIPLIGYKSVSIDKIDLATNTVSTLFADTNMANGMVLDGDRLLVCEQGTFAAPAAISAIDLSQQGDKAVPLVDQWDGLRFNSPNDVVVKNDGTIWFTDPSYGYLQGFKDAPQLGEYVYCFDPTTGYVTAVADSFIKPNGMVFSPDHKTLYVTDSGAIEEPGSYYVDQPHHVLAFDVSDNNRLSGQRLFAIVNPGIPDGIKVDSEGRVYVSCATGVKVYQPNGSLIGEILAQGACNFTFGGADNNQLYICVDTSVYVANLNATGP
ncbi:MAG: gluconolactonase [Phenylobacterium sp.]|jgi:gluconolactonase